jgi:hypothetical protein
MCVINGCWRPFSSIIAGIAGIFLMKSLRVNLIDGARNSNYNRYFIANITSASPSLENWGVVHHRLGQNVPA